MDDGVGKKVDVSRVIVMRRAPDFKMRKTKVERPQMMLDLWVELEAQTFGLASEHVTSLFESFAASPLQADN